MAMLIKALLSLHRMLLVAALAVALVATGFAHRMPEASDEALAFALENGISLADFCGGDLDGDGHRDPGCLACQIAGAVDLPSESGKLIDLELAFVARVIAPRESRALARLPDPANRPQGPPVA
jgi:hypothetical protein